MTTALARCCLCDRPIAVGSTAVAYAYDLGTCADFWRRRNGKRAHGPMRWAHPECVEEDAPAASEARS